MEETGFNTEIIKPDFMSGESERAMSTAIHTARRTSRLRIALDWLHEAQAALSVPAEQVSGMSDKDLRDIGLKPRSLSSNVYREIGKPRLVDFGWRLGR